MNGSGAPLLCAVRGPVMLITLGSLFAIDHLGTYPFGKTWPVLIIVFGIMKLLEATFASRRAGASDAGGNVS